MNRGVLLMAYGSPAALDEVPAYFTHIRGGRPPSQAAAEELRERYRAIGGMSPLRAITESQAGRLEAVLRARGHSAAVTVGMKHSAPFIADAVRAMAESGIRSATALALAPHYSRISVAGYFSTAAEAAAEHGVVLEAVESWHDHPGFIEAVARRLQAALARTTAPAVIFTAHSLPQRILTWNDPYPGQLRHTAELVASAAGVPQWRFAYQSASHTGEPWLGPDLLETLPELAREGVEEVVVCPVGFVADHLEVLYDIDVEARVAAGGLGLRLVRAPSLNDGDDFIAVLADLVEGA
jgi:ferrochelatase